MDDTDEKAELPIHLILGAIEYAGVKVNSMPRIGKPAEPIAELTRFGWTMMYPGFFLQEAEIWPGNNRKLATRSFHPPFFLTDRSIAVC